MTPTGKRALTIVAILVGTPIMGLFIGTLRELLAGDSSGLAPAAGFAVGILGTVSSAVFGPIVSFLMRKSEDQTYSLAGYILPSFFVLIYVLFLSLFSN